MEACPDVGYDGPQARGRLRVYPCSHLVWFKDVGDVAFEESEAGEISRYGEDICVDPNSVEERSACVVFFFRG